MSRLDIADTLTIYGNPDQVAALACVVEKYPGLWVDNGGTVRVPEEDFMRVAPRTTNIKAEPKVPGKLTTRLTKVADKPAKAPTQAKTKKENTTKAIPLKTATATEETSKKKNTPKGRSTTANPIDDLVAVIVPDEVIEISDDSPHSEITTLAKDLAADPDSDGPDQALDDKLR
ncbi:hypothetical protein LTR28_008038 [Elasticomyces elasticus]|nr:hypothetical protein LTR28_008038 [Elasticomyces elasticus]